MMENPSMTVLGKFPDLIFAQGLNKQKIIASTVRSKLSKIILIFQKISD